MSGGHDAEQGQCRDLPSLVALAIRRGYAKPELWAQWVLHKRERRAEKHARSTRHMRGRLG